MQKTEVQKKLSLINCRLDTLKGGDNFGGVRFSSYDPGANFEGGANFACKGRGSSVSRGPSARVGALDSADIEATLLLSGASKTCCAQKKEASLRRQIQSTHEHIFNAPLVT